jgi:hypothetical protein
MSPSGGKKKNARNNNISTHQRELFARKTKTVKVARQDTIENAEPAINGTVPDIHTSDVPVESDILFTPHNDLKSADPTEVAAETELKIPSDTEEETDRLILLFYDKPSGEYGSLRPVFMRKEDKGLYIKGDISERMRNAVNKMLLAKNVEDEKLQDALEGLTADEIWEVRGEMVKRWHPRRIEK